jgi:DNA repair protein RadC
LVGGPKQLEIATDLVSKYQTLAKLSRAPLTELTGFAGIGEAVATRLKAAMELGRRLLIETPDVRPQITSPADAASLVQHEMGLLEREEVRVILLNTRNRVLDIVTVYKGSLNTSWVRISELFTEAIRQVASAIVLIHNHPSGNSTPSPEDVRLTEMVVEAGKLLDIEIMDHICIGQGQFTSLKERGLGFN